MTDKEKLKIAHHIEDRMTGGGCFWDESDIIEDLRDCKTPLEILYVLDNLAYKQDLLVVYSWPEFGRQSMEKMYRQEED